MGDPRRSTKGGSADISRASNSASINSHEDPMCGSDGLLITHEKIAKRAYEIYEQGQYRDGQALTHWLEAEREIIAESRAMRAS
jgi:hypothetical protein